MVSFAEALSTKRRWKPVLKALGVFGRRTL
jgi:hypothetical protein